MKHAINAPWQPDLAVQGGFCIVALQGLLTAVTRATGLSRKAQGIVIFPSHGGAS